MDLHSVRALAAMVLLFVSANGWSFERERLVVVVESLPGDDLPGALVPVVAELLGAKGYRIVSGPRADAFIRNQGIARVSDQSEARLAELVKQFRADGLVVVKVTFHLPPAERTVGPRANAALGVVAHRVGPDGRVVWRSSAAALADEVSSRGSGATELALLASERALWSMRRAPEDPALEAVRDALRKKNALRQQQRQRPSTYRPPERHRVEAALKNAARYNKGPRFKLKMGKYRGTRTDLQHDAPPESAAPPPTSDREQVALHAEAELASIEVAPAEAPNPNPEAQRSPAAEPLRPPPVEQSQTAPLAQKAIAPVETPSGPEQPATQSRPPVESAVAPEAAPVEAPAIAAPGPAPSVAVGSAPAAAPSVTPSDGKKDIAPTLPREELPPAEKLLPGQAGARQLQASVSQKQPDVRRCVDGQLKRVPTTSANATVLISVGRAGRVTGVAVDAGRLKGSYFEQCLKSTALKSWVFPYSGSEYELELPIQIVATDG